MSISKKKISLLIPLLLSTNSVFADNSATELSERVQKTASELAPISLPSPLLADHMEEPVAASRIMDLNDAEGCGSYSSFSDLSSEALFNYIQGTSAECINELMRRNDDIAVNTYQATNVIDIAQRAQTMAQTYDSSSGDDLYRLFNYLRGAFYVESTNDKLTYQDKAPHQAMLLLLETYRSNPNFSEVTDSQGETLREYFTAWDSSKNFVQSIDVVTRYLNEFSPEHLQSHAHRSALTGALTLLYRASWDATYTKAAEEHTELRKALLKVANSDYIHQSEYGYEATDALKEYARFLEYHQYWNLSDSLAEEVTGGIVDFMSRFEPYSNAWVVAAKQLDVYNPNECEKYNICGWKNKLEEQVLSVHYSCSDTIKIRAQHMTTSELQQSCDLLAKEETLFHTVLKTNQQPVSDDYNTQLEINIFDSAQEYQNYAGTLFNISTDNGGMYLEGDPSQVDNQARFIAYEATWLEDILVWNLKHEYIHYLDGHFNMYGGFNYFRTDGDKSVWWSEGLAEYLSHQNRYDEAVELGRKASYSFSDILSNTYSSGDDRVYRWGYLAVRFLFESAPESVDQLMEYARAGDVAGWLNYLDTSIGRSLDQRWYDWLQTVQSDDTPLTAEKPNITVVPDSCKVHGPYEYGQINYGETACISSGKAHYFFYVQDDITRVDINSDHGEGNINVYYHPSSWADSNNYTLKSTNEGNRESITINNPQPGWQYITVESESQTHGASLKLDVTFEN